MKFPNLSLLDKKKLKFAARMFFWFSVGAFLALFLITNIVFIIFKTVYNNKVYPGIIVDGINFGGKTKEEVKDFYSSKNKRINSSFYLTSDFGTATVSAKTIDLGYDAEMISSQAYSLGRSKNSASNLSIIFQAYLNGIFLPPTYTFSTEKFKTIVTPLAGKIDKKPVDALFNFQNGRVSAFKPSEDGRAMDIEGLNDKINDKIVYAVTAKKPITIGIPIPIKTVKSNLTTEKVNDMGIKELIGEGTSLFQHSIPNRIFNVTLAATKLNGVLLKPGEIFSFNRYLGDISAATGFMQAYVIQNGKTVLGDGGGVCQVSTTFFRAALNTGLPIIERKAHAYRVGYYEQDVGPGIDATVYSPSVDLRFKNDTKHHILVQTEVDPSILSLSVKFYGTKDGRVATVSAPIILSQSPAKPTVYQDDPTLPKGTLKQVDFAAPGANVYFTRTVKKDGKEIISDKFYSNYQPWASVFLRGTKE